MRIRQAALGTVFLASALIACFEEGGEDSQRKAAEAVADGLLAFPDITNNVTTDPGLAADALQKFIKTPVAADQLLSPPFQITPGSELAKRIAVAPATLPGCVTENPPGAPVGCDGIQATQCEAGTFSFDGSGTRTCAGCPDMANVEGLCTYTWGMDVGFSDPLVGTLTTRSTGNVVTDAASVTGEVTFDGPFELTDKNDVLILRGAINVCACGTLTINPGPPRRLANSQFVVKDVGGPRCALVSFDAEGVASAELACVCPDNSTCAD